MLKHEWAKVDWSVLGISGAVGLAMSMVGASAVSVLYSWRIVLSGTPMAESSWVAYEANYVRIMSLSVIVIGYLIAGRLARRMAVKDTVSCINAGKCRLDLLRRISRGHIARHVP